MMISLPPAEFNFGGASASPNYISAPSSPPRLGSPLNSAPARVSAAAEVNGGNRVPFDWEADDSNEFAFDFSGQLEKICISPADELFDGGKIKPLSSLQYERKGNDPDRFTAALPSRSSEDDGNGSSIQRRGREINAKPMARRSNSRHKATSRSLSPFRASNLLIDGEETEIQDETNGSSLSTRTSWMWYRKWKLKDLLLFRSASEGRASHRGVMNRYDLLQKKHREDAKNSSFRSTESVGSTSSRRRGPLSAHELHYTLNRAASEEMKRKTFLPYKQGLLGCLGFHSRSAAAAAAADISKGLPFMLDSRHQ